MNLRESVFSGSWYPSNRQACEDQIHQFIEEGKNRSLSVKTRWAASFPTPAGIFRAASPAT
jgi:predicted class III extradiol MEMO1 family dioxygenase